MAAKKKKVELKKILATIIIVVVAIAFVGSFALSRAPNRGRASSIAIVNREPISMSSDSLLANLYRQYYEEERQKNKEKGITEEQNRQIMRRALDVVIQRTLILQYIKKEGIKVSKDTVLSSIIKKGYYASPNARFDEERYNNTPESDKQRIFESEEEQILINLFYDEYFRTVRVSDVEVKAFFQLADYGKKIEYVLLRYDDLPEENLKAFYDENPKLFEKAHVAHILIKDNEDKAKEVLKEVQSDPDNFEEIAKRESEDTTNEKGGDLGWFYRKDMVPEFSEAAFKLKKGEISAVVKTIFGFHILKAIDSVKVEPFNEALPRVKREYVNTNREEIEKKTSLKSKEIIEVASKEPQLFKETLLTNNLTATTTNYITLSNEYILNEEQTLPLYELMNNKSLLELVFSIKVGQIGGPIKTPDGEIIFKVIDEKKFDQENYDKMKGNIEKYYRTLKENFLFNDWYIHKLKNSNIVDNFNQFFKQKNW